MSDPNPAPAPGTSDPEGAPVENPSGALDLNPDLPLVDPTGGEGA